MTGRTVERMVEKHGGRRTALISILHEVQDRYRYLPPEALKTIARKMGIDLNELYGVATFYKAFSLTPRGKHSVILCQGTACHVRGGPKVLRRVKDLLGIEAGQTSRDRLFSLEVVNCLGVCAVGPVMIVDGRIYGEMNAAKARRVLEALKKNGNGGRA